MSHKFIIKNIEEFKEHFPIEYTEDGFQRLNRFIRIAQRDYLRPILGKQLLEDLINYHNASQGSDSGDSESTTDSGGSSSTCLASLLPYAQDVVAGLSMFEGFGLIEISVGAHGITQNSTDSEKQPIYSSQRVNAKRDLLRQGMNDAEEMLLFLEENKSSECFSGWAESEERTDMVGHILPTAQMFTQYWSNMGNKRLTYMALRSRMIDVEEQVVRPLLGETLYAQLMGQLKAEVSTTNAKLLTYLRPMVAKFTAARGMPELVLHVEAFGVFHYLTEKNERSTEVLSPADDKRMELVKTELIREAEGLRQDLINYLNENATAYPLFSASKAYIAPEEDTISDSDSGTEFLRYRI